MCPLVCKHCWKHCSTPTINDSPLTLLGPKEDVQLLAPMMETDSGVNDGN